MQLLSVLKKDLKLLLRDRGQLVSLFLLPLVFILPICLAFPANGYNLQSDYKRRLPLVNLDTVQGKAEQHSQELVDALAESFQLESAFDAATVQSLQLTGDPACAQLGAACDEQVIRTLVRQGQRTVGVVIPSGLTAAIDAGERISMTLLYDPAGDAIERQIYEAVLNGAALKLSIQNQVLSGFSQFQDMLAVAPDELQQTVQATIAEEEEQAKAKSAAPETEQQAALSIVTTDPSNYTLPQRPNTLQQTVPGYTVMFVFFLIGYLTSALKLEKNNGTFRRLLQLPASRSALLGGKLLSGFVIGLVQVAIMLGVGRTLGMGLGNNPIALLLLTMAVALSAVGLGLAATAFNVERALSMPLIISALIGGCMFPADWLPQFVRTVGLFVPQTWAMSGYQDLLTRGQGLAQVLPEIGVLLLFAAVAFMLAVRRFDFGD